jgi:hypothetical protein
MSVSEVAKAVQVLAPLVEQVVTAIRSGETPEFLTSLPDTLRSRVTLELIKARFVLKDP